MGMILEQFGQFSVEVRRESFILHHEDDRVNIHEGCSPEYYIRELDDMMDALKDAREYIRETRGASDGE